MRGLRLNFSSLLLFLTLQTLICNSKSIKFPVSNIPADLMVFADAVARLDQGEFHIYSLEKATYYGKQVFTILNEKGAKYGHFSKDYDSYSKIKYLKGSVYDKNGKLIKKFKNSEIEDESISDYSLFNDSRIKSLEYHSNTYPYTVEYEYEIDYKGFVYYPSWFFLFDNYLSIQKSSYKIIAPENIEFKYLENNIGTKVEITHHENQKEYLWEMENIKSLITEPYCPTFRNIAPNIQFSPNEFYYGGHYGNFKDWDSFGKWQLELLKDRQTLPQETKDAIIQMTTSIPDTLGKIKAVFEFMQSRTRYVSIQVGIGGYQPFSAETVDKLGYGDCKALSNYTKSLLEIIGIPSYYTIIYSGERKREINLDYPNISYFNHAILTVPLQDDTLWLECTSQKLPFAFVHKDIADRDALMITENGAKIINLPTVDESENLKLTSARIQLMKNGYAIADILSSYQGFRYEDVYNIKYQDSDKQEKWLYKSFDIPSFTINYFDIGEVREPSPKSILNTNLQINNLASKSGSRLIVPLNLMNKVSYVPYELHERKYKIEITNGYCDIDTIVYEIPKTFKIENVSENVEINSIFGRYSTSIIKKDGKLIYTRYFIIKRGIYDESKYEELRDFYRQIERYDRDKVVLIQNN